MAHDSHPCPSCGGSLEQDNVCLACVFEEALEADGSRSGAGSESSLTGFGDYAPPAAGVFGKYILREKLGEGGMGVIWEAEDTTLQRVVALKMIRGFAFSRDSEAQRFQTEANAIAQLDHPNIVPIYEVGEIEDQPYYGMKLLSGGPLSKRLQEGMDLRGVVAIMEKLARAIGHAHECGVLHRDLKPDNVLFDAGEEPYLTDFGLAKMLDSPSGLTLSHAYLGTPHYMSPEQARGCAGDIGTASDVWACGALFYYMLSGKAPFPGTSIAEILDRISTEKPPPMERSSGEKIDEQLETLCLNCLQKDPGQRLPSAEFLADELERWLNGESIQTKAVRRNATPGRVWKIATIGVMGCVLATAALFGAHKSGAPSQSEPAGANSSSSSSGIDLTQTSRVEHVYLDATEGAGAAGVWIEPGDAIRFTVEGGYTLGDDPQIWSSAGDEENNFPAGEGFTFPDQAPWALVGVVQSDWGEKDHFAVAEEVVYAGRAAGELSFALNTLEGEVGSAGGFVISLEAERQSKLFVKGTDGAKAWGAPMLQPADSYLNLRMNVAGEIQFSGDGNSVPAGLVSSEGHPGLLAPHLGEHAVIAKIGGASAFALKPGYNRYDNNLPGWLRVSVNDEITRPMAYADNRGSLEVSALVYRNHRTFARSLTLGEITLRPLSFEVNEKNTTPGFYVSTQALEAATKSPQYPPVLLQSKPSADTTRVTVTAIQADADTYAFVVEDFPSDPGTDPSRKDPYISVEDAETVYVRWGGSLYNRSLFRRREPLAYEPGAQEACSFEVVFDSGQSDWPGQLYLAIDRDGRLRVGEPDGTEAFKRAATWILGLVTQ